MTDHDELRERYVQIAATELTPLHEAALTAVESESPESLNPILWDLLASAFMQGVGAGQAEVAAQVIEAGVDLKINQAGGPEGGSS